VVDMRDDREVTNVGRIHVIGANFDFNRGIGNQILATDLHGSSRIFKSVSSVKSVAEFLKAR
jgi:hypothetical protein